MAFKNVNNSFKPTDEKRKLTELQIGEALTGYLLEISKYVDKDSGEPRSSLVFQIDGKRVLVYPAGNVKYAIQDNKLTEGQMTRITRQDDRKVGARKMKSSHFLIEQDPEDVVSADALDSVLGTSPSNPIAGAPAAASKAERERAATLAKAKRLE